MKTDHLAKDYRWLTPEERFRLILAASGRGDAIEEDRLLRAGQRITLTMADHAPYVRAFDELAQWTFLELLEAASIHHDAIASSIATGPRSAAEDNMECGDEGFDESTPDANREADPADGTDADDTAARLWEPHVDLALAAAFVLRTKAAGWRLFCARLHIPPFLLWQMLPGWERLQRALASAERVAFHPDGFLRWINHVRPAGEPERTDIVLTANAVADAIERMFRQRVPQWGG